MAQKFTAVVQFDEESRSYVGFVPALPGCHTCANSLDALRENLREAIELMVEDMATDGETPTGDVQITLEPIEIELPT